MVSLPVPVLFLIPKRLRVLTKILGVCGLFVVSVFSNS